MLWTNEDEETANVLALPEIQDALQRICDKIVCGGAPPQPSEIMQVKVMETDQPHIKRVEGFITYEALPTDNNLDEYVVWVDGYVLCVHAYRW